MENVAKSLKFCTLTRNLGWRIERRCLNLHREFINNLFCACAVHMLLKMAVNAAVCSTFKVQYGKSTSTRTTAIGHLGYSFTRSRDFAHVQKHTSFNTGPCNVFADNFNYFHRKATKVAQ